MITSCEKCLFAKRDENKNQIGCEFNRIELYIQQNTPIISLGEPSHYEIGGRVCSLCRAEDMNWAENLSLEEKKKKARSEVISIIDVITICNNKTSVLEIIETAKSVENQNGKNTLLHVLIPKEIYPQVAKAMRQHFPAKTTKLAWRIQVCVDNNTKEQEIDLAVNEIESKSVLYYLIVDAGAILSDNLIFNIDSALNDKLQRFIYLKEFDAFLNSKSYQIGPLVHCATHRSLGGNKLAEHDIEYEDGKKETIRCDTILDKIIQVSKDQNILLIGDLYDICCPQ